MHPISTLTSKVAKKIRVIATDIDDTISTEGKILPEAYEALWKLQRVGLDVLPITGRCAGWCDHIARMWPVKGVVGENGAFYMYMNENLNPKRLQKRYFIDPQTVKINQEKFEAIKARVFARFPSCKLASDQSYREFDLAIDFREDVPPLSTDEVKEVVQIFESFGARVKVSSIHVNGWFGDYDKLTMTRIFIQEQLGFSIDQHPEWVLFIGDSPNDQPMFKFFPNSVGVQNINRFVDMISNPPQYVTNQPGGLGFAEMVEILLNKRK